MSTPTAITTLAEARAALGEEIASNRSQADYYQRESDKSLAIANRYSSIAYELERLRKRMDEPVAVLAVVGVEQAA